MIADLAARYHAGLDLIASATGALAAAATAIAVFFAILILEKIAALIAQRAAKRRTAVGLYKEIGDRLVALAALLGEEGSRDRLSANVRADPNFRPLLIVDDKTRFYDLSVSALPGMRTSALAALADFYRRIDRQIALARAFEGKAFATLGDDARAAILDDFWTTCRQAETEGREALRQLERAYPRWWFRALKPTQ